MRRVVLIGTLIGLLACGTRVPLNRLMSWPEYGRTTHAVPYILKVDAKPGVLLYFGAEHMKGQPYHAQVEQIEARWREFRPSIAFSEGWDPPVEQNPQEAVRLYGEPGLVRYLAKRDGVPVNNMEPPEKDRYKDLRRRFTAEQIRLYMITQNVYQNLRSLPREEVEKQVIGQIRRRFETEPLLTGLPRTIPEVEDSFRRLLPHVQDWRRMTVEEVQPYPPKSFLGEISASLGTYRDRFMVSLLIRSVQKGERVFAVVGASHVVMQEPVLRKTFPGLTRVTNAPP